MLLIKTHTQSNVEAWAQAGGLGPAQGNNCAWGSVCMDHYRTQTQSKMEEFSAILNFSPPMAGYAKRGSRKTPRLQSSACMVVFPSPKEVSLEGYREFLFKSK